MKIVIKDNDFKKLHKKYAKEIDESLDILKNQIEGYRKNKIRINDIRHDPKIIHAVLSDNNRYYYVFANRIKRLRIRLLYTVKDNTIFIIDAFIKNNANTTSNTEYLRKFKNTIRYCLPS